MLILYHQPHPSMISMRMWAHASSWNLILQVASQTQWCRKHNDAGNKCRKHDGYRKHDGAGNMMVHVPHMYQPEHAYMHSNTFQCMRSDSFAKTLPYGWRYFVALHWRWCIGIAIGEWAMLFACCQQACAFPHSLRAVCQWWVWRQQLHVPEIPGTAQPFQSLCSSAHATNIMQPHHSQQFIYIEIGSFCQ